MGEPSDHPVQETSQHKKQTDDDDREFHPGHVVSDGNIPLRDGPPDRMGQGYIFDQVAGGSQEDEPGKTPSAFYHDVVAGAGGDEPASQADGDRVQDHEGERKVGALYALFILAGYFPIVDDGPGLAGRLGNFELDDLIRSEGGEVIPYPDHVGYGKKKEKPEKLSQTAETSGPRWRFHNSGLFQKT